MSKQVCGNCKGRKSTVGLGMIESDCKTCDKTGFVEVTDEKPIEEAKSVRKRKISQSKEIDAA